MLLSVLCACAYVDPSLTDQITVYSDIPVRKSAMQISVHPKGKQYRPLTAYIYPFVIQQQNSDYHHLSTAFTEIFNNAWTEERLFSIQEFQPGTPYQGLNVALERARRRGADLLVIGYVPYFYAGHTLDDTAITIKMNIYTAGNGNLIWSMLQSGRIESKNPDDYIYFRHEFRMNKSPFNKIIRSIAKDMAIPLKAWLPDPDAQFQFARTPQQVQTELASPARTLPASQENETRRPKNALSDTWSLPAAGGAKSKGNPNDAYSGGATRSKGSKIDRPAKRPTKGVGNNNDRPTVKGVNLAIKFRFNKSEINPQSYKVLDALGEALNSPDLKGKKIIVGGHTDHKGSVAYNLELSKKRAQSVKDYLVNKWGIDPNLIESTGYGKSRPLTTGTTAEDMEKNRRVEIRLSE